MATSQRRSLRRWRPATHGYTDRGIGLYDGALLLVDAAHIRVGDHALVGSSRGVARYRVRHVAHCPGYPEYWRVRVEVLERATATQPDEAAA